MSISLHNPNLKTSIMESQTNLTLFYNYNNSGSLVFVSLMIVDSGGGGIYNNHVAIRNPHSIKINLDTGNIIFDNLTIARFDTITILFEKCYEVETHQDKPPTIYEGTNNNYFVKEYTLQEIKTTRMQIFMFELVVWSTQAGSVQSISLLLDDKTVFFDTAYIQAYKNKLQNIR